MIPPPRRGPLPSTLLLCLALLPVPLTSTGCSVIGVAAQALPEKNVPARYAGLRDHSAAVLVWLPRGLETDYPALRLDLVTAVQSRLRTAQQARKREVQGASFPHSPASLVRFQEDHPELERSPIVSVAPRLGVGRVVYIEVENFQTRSDQSVDLFRGSATISLRVVEVENGRGKVAYEEAGLTSVFPPAAPAEGIPNADDARIYRGTVDQLARGIARRFYTHAPGK